MKSFLMLNTATRQAIIATLAYRHSTTTWSRRSPGRGKQCLGFVGVRALVIMGRVGV